MKTSRKFLIVGSAVLVLAAGLAGVGRAVGGGDDQNVTGPAADRARAAAIAIVPGGKVNAVERDSEKGATWEVEVTRPDGKTVDVRLDAAYKQVAIDGDTEEAGDTEEKGETGEHGETGQNGDTD